MNPLNDEVAAIHIAIRGVCNPPPAIKRAAKTLQTLQRRIDEHNAQPERAVEDYSTARIQLVFDWAIEHQMGFCSIGDHLTPLDEIEGLIVTGAYVSSGYYESLHSYTDRKTVCRQHRHGLESGSGRYDGEFRNYQSYELKEAATSLGRLSSNPYLERLAKAHGIELPPKASYDRHKGVTIGDILIKL